MLKNLKKVMCAKILICIFFPFLLFASIDPPSPYLNAFDESIYNQQELRECFAQLDRSSSNCSTEVNPDLAKEILRSLFHKKVLCLEARIFKAFDQEIEDLKILIAQYKPTTAQKTLELVGGVLSSATVFAFFGVLPPDSNGTIIIGTTATATMTGSFMKGLANFIKPDGQLDLDKMKFELERKKKELIVKINQEPFSNMEIDYVLKKRFYSIDIQKQIEKTFLRTRVGGGLPADFTRTFLENCLKLPVQKKQIDSRDPYWNLEYEETSLPTPLKTPEQHKARNKLKSYCLETRKEIQKAITGIVHTSHSTTTSYRRCFYLWGKPGFGKSTAARSIATLLELPYFEINIRTSADISQLALEGGDWQRQMGNPGSIARALTTEEKIEEAEYVEIDVPLEIANKYDLPPIIKAQVPRHGKKTYDNAVFVINDLDRLLLDSNTSIQVLSFLLDYLDPEKKNFNSPYFSAPIKTSGLLFFITGNSRIPSQEQFDALRDRCVEIEFKPFEQSARSQILSEFCDNMRKIYECAEDTTFREQMLRETVKMQSLRKAQKYIEGKIIEAVGDDIRALTGGGTASRTQVSARGGQIPRRIASPIIRQTFPPTFQDGIVSSFVLENIAEAARLLNSVKQEEQIAGGKNLFGEYSWWPYMSNNGLIVGIWGKNGHENLQAFANRLRRKTPQQKHILVDFHITLVRAITDSLLILEDFVRQEILSDYIRRQNIQKFHHHLCALELLENQHTCEDVVLEEKDKEYLLNYVEWSRIGRKISIFMTMYNIVNEEIFSPTRPLDRYGQNAGDLRANLLANDQTSEDA